MDDSNDEKSQPPQVGYKKPPAEHRFPKGVSGNPRGRPKGSGSLAAAFAEVGVEKVPMREGGKVRMVTLDEARVRQIYAQAGKGVANARRELMRMCRVTGAFTAWRAKQPTGGGVKVVSSVLSSPEAIAAFKRHEAARRARGEKNDPRYVPVFVLPDWAKD